MKRSALLLWLFLLFSQPVLGQEGVKPTTVNASGNGFVELPADYAALVLGVQIDAATPDSATARMGRRLDRVVDTLASLGVPRDSLPTSRLDVRPIVSNVDGRRVTSYQAGSMVRLRVWDLERVSEILSAAIAAGATTIERLDYRSTEERAGRDEALRLATEEANRDARIMAEAQGMELSRLVSTSSSISSVGFDRNLVGFDALTVTASRMRSSLIPARIVPIGVSVSVHVSVEWEIR